MVEPEPRREGSARILLVDDHPVVRQGLAITLGRSPGLTICGEASGLPDAMQAIREEIPDLVLADLDLDGANGIDLVKAVRAQYPDMPVLILSMHDEEVYAERVLRAGARGYLMKQETPERLVGGVRAALAGEIVLSEKMKMRILGNLARSKGSQPGLSVDRLTDRELEVFRLIGEGRTTREIADRLSLSIKTIEAHIAHIKTKLYAGSGRDLQRRAFAWFSGPGPGLRSA
jgi:DNA-binding NarL/FixJ family response regulator